MPIHNLCVLEYLLRPQLCLVLELLVIPLKAYEHHFEVVLAVLILKPGLDVGFCHVRILGVQALEKLEVLVVSKVLASPIVDIEHREDNQD